MKSAPDKQQQVKKIVVKPDYELTDVVAAINDTDNGRIQLTFTENSDLLVSPIGLKVIQDVTDEQDKSLVLQIISNPSGERNASEAGITYSESASSIDEGIWEDAERMMTERTRNHTTMLKGNGNSTKAMGSKLENGTADEFEYSEDTKEISKSKKAEIEEVEEDTNYVENIVEESEDEIQTHVDIPVEKSEYSKRVEQALQRSRETIEQGGVRVIKTGSLELALDDDIADVRDVHKENLAYEDEPDNSSKYLGSNRAQGMGVIAGRQKGGEQTQSVRPRIQNLTGRDLLNGADFDSNADTGNTRHKSPTEGGFKGAIFGIVGQAQTIGKGIGPKVQKILKSKGLIYLLIPVVIVVILGLWIAYKIAPLARVDISITSTPVEISEEFVGDPSTTTFSLEDRAMRVKTEALENELSEGATATGTAFRGEKAGGAVTVKCLLFSGTESIPAGTQLKANGKNYVTISDIAVSCPGVVSTTVSAADVGEEYNQPVGTIFSVGAYPATDVVGINDGAAISGGSKEEYRVISQGDVDAVTKVLKQQAEDSANSKLSDFEKDGWVIIKSSVKHEADGKVTTDIPVGTEAELFNVTAKYKSTALFYNKKDIEDIAEDLLLSMAQEKNLFEADDQISLKLNEKITKEVTVKNIAENKVTAELKVSGAVTPDVSKADIIKDLQGEKWTDGVKYLENLPYAVTKPKVSFMPTWIPEGMWYFPTRQGRIIVTIKMVSAPTVAEPTVTE